MVGIAEPETAIETIEATLNYFKDTGEQPFTYTGGPGSLDVRTGGGQDPRRVVIRNGRRDASDFTLDRNGFRFVAPRHQGRGLLRRGRGARNLLPGDGSAGEGAERRIPRGRVRSYAAHRRRRGARGAQDPRGGAPRAQRLHRMVGPAARARRAAAGGRRAAAPALRHRAGVAADPPSGRDLPARRSAMRRACRPTIWWCRSGAIPTASARPTRSPTIRRTAGTGSRACGATRRWSSRSTIRSRTACARWTAHTAFDDPTSPPDARPRESIEIRTLAFF